MTGEYFYLSFRGDKANANFPEVSVTASNLLPPYGKSGTLNLSVSGLQTLLDASGTTDAVDVTLEVSVSDTGSVVDTYSATVRAVEDLI